MPESVVDGDIAARRLILHSFVRCKIFVFVFLHFYNNMTLTHEQLAELLAGIARSQQAIVDAMDRAQPGFRGTYLLPTLNVAANLRIPQTRLLDLPSRILLRSQGRAPMDADTIQRSLHEALEGSAVVDPPPSLPTVPSPSFASALAKSAQASISSVAAVAAISADAEKDFFES